VATQYASAPCKLTVSSHLFARWRCCSGITISSYSFARWHLFRHVGYLRHQQQVDRWPFDLESGVRVTCDVATSVPNSVFIGLSVLELGPMYATDVRRQTSDRRRTKTSLNASALWRRRHNKWKRVRKNLTDDIDSEYQVLEICHWPLWTWYIVMCSASNDDTSHRICGMIVVIIIIIYIIIYIIFSPHDNYTVYRKMSPFIYSSDVKKKRNQCTQYIPIIATASKSIYNFALNLALTYILLCNFSW